MISFRLIWTLGFGKELISSLIPTSFVYVDIFNKILTRNIALILAIVVFIILSVILVLLKVREYQRGVSKALATGYFKSFVEKLIQMFVSKGDNKIKFIFENDTKEFYAQQTEIAIYLENSHTELKQKNNEIRKTARIAYVDKGAFNYPFFVWAKVENDKLFIYDLPRTLFSLKDYIDSQIEEESDIDKETKKFFKMFNEEFKNLWNRLETAGLDVKLVG